MFVDLTGVPFNDTYRYSVYELLVGLAAAIALEADPGIKERIGLAQGLTVISWCTFAVVYLFPMRGINASTAVVSIQIGYCASDIISKCGVGILIYQITYAKSSKEGLIYIGVWTHHLSVLNSGPGGVGRRRAASCAPLLRSVPRD